MMEKTKTIDYGNKFIKLLLRKAMITLIHPETALDMFAGRGEIAAALYQGFNELHCVEKDAKKFSALEKNLSFVSGPQIHLHLMDNREFLKTRVNKIHDINLVDFDAYGSPNIQIKIFFDNYRLTQPTLIFATDGGKLACMRGGKLSPYLYSSRPDSNCRGNACNPILIKGYEKLICQFWQEMAEAYSFSIKVFKIFWKKRKQVAYYGLLISPR